jgi:hypothetical protein
MAFTLENIDTRRPASEWVKKERVIDPRSKKTKSEDGYAWKWWLAQNDADLLEQLLSTTSYLKHQNDYQRRKRKASLYSRLFSGHPLYNFFATSSSMDASDQFPIGRPTANVCYSCTDTLVSRLSQDRPKPTFLTDNGNYKERRLSQEANQFIQGELFRTKSYEKGALMLRDACVLGNGLLKVFAQDDKVQVERTLETELLTDYNDAYYGEPRQLIQTKLVDRNVFMNLFPKEQDIIIEAIHGNADTSPKSIHTIADQFVISEGWHLPSSEKAKDGRHCIACSAGMILDEPWTLDKFPFVKLGYNPNVVGWFAQSLIEILMPTQMEIYRQLIVGSQNFEIMGVPRVLVEEMSKILDTSFNNRAGTIIRYRNTAPEFVNAESNAPDWMPYVEFLISNAYQMAGISSMSAGGIKPQGLNSGEAIRQYDAIQEDRFAALAKRYQSVYTDLSYLMIDVASEIVEETGSYTTVFPGKDGTREVDFKSIGLLSDTYIIQCYDESSLPKDPAGRQAKLSEMLAANEITPQEFRRLSNFPDLEQSDKLANALEERILYCLDDIIDHGRKNWAKIAPDQWILDPTGLAMTLSTQTLNLYAPLKLEEDKMQALRDWQTQVQALIAAATPPPPPQVAPQGAPGAQAPLPIAPPNPSIAPTSGAQV